MVKIKRVNYAHVGDAVEYFYRGEGNLVQVEEIVRIDGVPYARISPSGNTVHLVACANMGKTSTGWIINEEITLRMR
jgi:hypothetical protein